MTTPTRPTPPTRETLELAQKVALAAFEHAMHHCTNPDNGMGPRSMALTARNHLAMVSACDYALGCLTAAEQTAAPEKPGEPEKPAGIPGWRQEGDGEFRAYIGEPVDEEHVLYADHVGWTRWLDDGGTDLMDKGSADTLAEAVRAASESWNAAYPGLPPVVVPERFRTPVPGVALDEPAESSDGSWGEWVDWAGGECPVPADTEVEARDHAGLRYRVPASALLWAHIKSGNCDGDIVRYRVRLPKPAEPAPESDAAFLARQGVGEWEPLRLDDGTRCRLWSPAWCAIASEGYIYPKAQAADRLGHPPGDTTTPEGRAALDANLVEHLRAEGCS